MQAVRRLNIFFAHTIIRFHHINSYSQHTCDRAIKDKLHKEFRARLHKISGEVSEAMAGSGRNSQKLAPVPELGDFLLRKIARH